MNVLITGSAGFVGSHLAEAFAANGDDVYGIDNYETGRKANWPDTMELDITARHLLYQYANFTDPDLVVHCAASYKNPDRWHRDTQVNVEGAINVAAVARHHECPIVYFQTVLPPISSYAISKIAGEYYLRLSGQPLTVYRLASVYGPRNLSGPIPTFYKRIKAGETCTVVENVTRDFVFVKDLVERVMGDLSLPVPGVYDIGSGAETPISDLPQLIGDALRVEPLIQMRPKATDDVARYDMAPEPMFMPVPLSVGINVAVQWYEQNGVDDTYTHLTIKD